MRTLVPAETLVYLESNDLAAALQPIVDSKPFTDVAKSKPDLSALKGVQVAVAVTGFETTEEKLTDEHSVGRIQPQFVAVADTHAWNYQAVGFAEKKLGAFVEKIYDSEPTLEKSDKNGGKYFTWKANDGRKAYALVVDSLIYFGNDETAIDKCLAVRRGEADSIAKAGKVVPAAPGTLASGYVGPDGIAQIANIIGLKFASELGEDSEVQSAIAGILPQLLRKSVTDVTWTQTKNEQGIEDNYSITMPAEIANIFNETMATNGEAPELLFSKLPDPTSATRYNLKNPQVSWRSVLLVLRKLSDPPAANMFGVLSGVLFEPYGIHDPETFLSSVDSNIVTGKVGHEGDNVFAVATMRDLPKARSSIDPDLKPLNPSYWRDNENEIEAVFRDSRIVIGSKGALVFLFDHGGEPLPPTDLLTKLGQSKAPIATVGKDNSTSSQIVDMLVPSKTENTKVASTYFTETRFTKTGIDRRTTSDFGLIGLIIAQLGED